MGVTAGIFLASILLKEMRYLVYIRYLWLDQPNFYQQDQNDSKVRVYFSEGVLYI
jgi:hypothetical protein